MNDERVVKRDVANAQLDRHRRSRHVGVNFDLDAQEIAALGRSGLKFGMPVVAFASRRRSFSSCVDSQIEDEAPRRNGER